MKRPVALAALLALASCDQTPKFSTADYAREDARQALGEARNLRSGMDDTNHQIETLNARVGEAEARLVALENDHEALRKKHNQLIDILAKRPHPDGN